MTQPQGPDSSPAARLLDVAARPARLVPMICQMILGIALLVALVLKAYMAVLTDHQCVPDAVSLGNVLRCEPTLGLMGTVLALSAGFELVRALFSEGLERIATPLILALGATLLHLLAGYQTGAGWREALLILSLVVAIGGIIWITKALMTRQ